MAIVRRRCWKTDTAAIAHTLEFWREVRQQLERQVLHFSGGCECCIAMQEINDALEGLILPDELPHDAVRRISDQLRRLLRRSVGRPMAVPLDGWNTDADPEA